MNLRLLPLPFQKYMMNLRLLPHPPPTCRFWWTHRLLSCDYYQTTPRPTPHPMAGADWHTDYSLAKINPRLLPGPPPTQWQVLLDTHIIPNIRLRPFYSQRRLTRHQSFTYLTTTMPINHPHAGPDIHTDSQAMTTRLFPGHPPTQWQVLIDTQTTPKPRLIPDYSQAHPPPSSRS